MYDRQILADHFRGLRTADDPAVQREFQLLKQQAQIDWKDMYGDRPEKRDPRVTPQSIEEDYIYNARLLAETQHSFARAKWIAGLVGVAIIAMVLWWRH